MGGEARDAEAEVEVEGVGEEGDKVWMIVVEG